MVTYAAGWLRVVTGSGAHSCLMLQYIVRDEVLGSWLAALAGITALRELLAPT
jgi:hypothetical protein